MIVEFILDFSSILLYVIVYLSHQSTAMYFEHYNIFILYFSFIQLATCLMKPLNTRQKQQSNQENNQQTRA